MKVTVTRGGVQDVEANAGRRIEVAGFDAFAPGVEGGRVVEGAAGGVKQVEPKGWGDLKLAVEDAILD